MRSANVSAQSRSRRPSAKEEFWRLRWSGEVERDGFLVRGERCNDGGIVDALGERSPRVKVSGGLERPRQPARGSTRQVRVETGGSQGEDWFGIGGEGRSDEGELSPIRLSVTVGVSVGTAEGWSGPFRVAGL